MKHQGSFRIVHLWLFAIIKKQKEKIFFVFLNLVFFDLLTGKYELIPFYKGENTVFDVSPRVIQVSVEHQHVIVPQKFQVRQFPA